MPEISFRTFGTKDIAKSKAETYLEFEAWLRHQVYHGGVFSGEQTFFQDARVRLKLANDCGIYGRFIRVTLVDEKIQRIDVYEAQDIEIHSNGVRQPRSREVARHPEKFTESSWSRGWTETAEIEPLYTAYEYTPGKRQRIGAKLHSVKDRMKGRITRHRSPNLDFQS